MVDVVLQTSNKTLLDGVNEVMKRAKLIQGDSGALTSLTDSARQVWIDNIVQIWNEIMEQLYATSDTPMPTELAEDTITLVTSDRDYQLDTFNQLYFPFNNETTGQKIYEYPGSYLDLVNIQSIPANYTGQPHYGVIRPTDKHFYLDAIPTSNENGDIYKYRYDKDISLSTAAASFPFDNSVFRALVPAVKQVFFLNDKREFNQGEFNISMGRASALLNPNKQRTTWGKRRNIGVGGGIERPFD